MASGNIDTHGDWIHNNSVALGAAARLPVFPNPLRARYTVIEVTLLGSAAFDISHDNATWTAWSAGMPLVLPVRAHVKEGETLLTGLPYVRGSGTLSVVAACVPPDAYAG
jgi:hypothetical protein